MTIGAISFQPYVYNVNAVSAVSMNKLSRISDNVLDKKTEYKGITENENPLKKGQTLDFQGMLEMQMQRGRSNAARIMKPMQEPQETEQAEPQETEQAEAATAKFDRGGFTDTVQDGQNVDGKQVQETAENVQPAVTAMETDENGDVSSFRMRQAISAYEMFMTA